MKRIAAIALPVLALAACAQLSRSDCEAGDWLGIGQRDGAQGRGATYVARHVESCGRFDVAVDTSLWEQGRQQGLRAFCTPQTQYEAGRSGRKFNEICAVENLPVHHAAYEKGRKYYELTRRIEHLRAEIRDLRQQAAEDRGPDAPRLDLALESFMIRMQIDALSRERRAYASL